MDKAFVPHISKGSLLDILGSKKGGLNLDDVLTAEDSATFDYAPPQPEPVVEKVKKPKRHYSGKKSTFHKSWWMYSVWGNCLTSVAVSTEQMWLYVPAMALHITALASATSPMWLKKRGDRINNDLNNRYDKIDKGYLDKGYKHLDDKF